MRSQLKTNFSLATAGWLSMAALATALSLGIPDTASAQQNRQNGEYVPNTNTTPYSPNAQHQQETDAKSRGGDNDFLPHFLFFEYMKNAGGTSCCHMKDAVKDVEIRERPGDTEKPYEVLLRYTQYGLKLEQPIWVPFEGNKLLTPEHAEKICAPYNEQAEARGEEPTCFPPAFSVIFISDGTGYIDSNSDGIKDQHTLAGGRKVDPDYIVKPEEYTTNPSVYCGWEEPDL